MIETPLERAAHDAGLLQCLADSIQPCRGNHRIRVKKEEGIAAGLLRARIHLRGALGFWRFHHDGTRAVGEVPGRVVAATIRHDQFNFFSSLLAQAAKNPGNVFLFI